jgi:hypothetical protein
MSVYLSNAFSLQMQGENDCYTRRVTLDEAKGVAVNLVPGPYIDRESEKDGSDAIYSLTAQSCVGHTDIAAVLSGLIGYTVPVNRVSVSLKPGDTLVVGQYVGPRLPEGCSVLPEGARIEWYVVECKKTGTVSAWREAFVDFKNATSEHVEFGGDVLEKAAQKHYPRYFEENACD